MSGGDVDQRVADWLSTLEEALRSQDYRFCREVEPGRFRPLSLHLEDLWKQYGYEWQAAREEQP